jgi:hypothetical protein
VYPGPNRFALPEIVARTGTRTYVGETGGPFCWQFQADQPETCVSYYFQPDRLDETVTIAGGDEIAIDIVGPSQLLTLTARLERDPGPAILEWNALDHEHGVR